jgi:hypothetical protein
MQHPLQISYQCFGIGCWNEHFLTLFFVLIKVLGSISCHNFYDIFLLHSIVFPHTYIAGNEMQILLFFSWYLKKGITFFYCFSFLGWGETESLGTSTSIRLTVLALDDDECGAVGITGKGNGNIESNTSPVLLCWTQIPHDLTLSRTRVATVGSRPLAAWTTSWSGQRVHPIYSSPLWRPHSSKTQKNRNLYWSRS